MMNIFKKLFLILKSTNSKINDFENFIEKWEKDSKKDSENKMIEVEKKYKEIFINYKNKNDFTNTRYTTDFLFGNLTKEEYDKKLIQFQKDVKNAIIKVEKRKIEPVYDFEVKGTNNFSSNNMVIHNCKHDDGMDLLSMINALEVIYPAKNMSYIPTKIKDGRVAADDIYGMINRYSDEEYSAYDSY